MPDPATGQVEGAVGVAGAASISPRLVRRLDARSDAIGGESACGDETVPRERPVQRDEGLERSVTATDDPVGVPGQHALDQWFWCRQLIQLVTQQELVVEVVHIQVRVE